MSKENIQVQQEGVVSDTQQYQEKILKLLLILIWALALIHMTAEYYYLYWTLRWFDIVTHFLGGVWVGAASIWFWFFSGYVHCRRVPYTRAIAVGLLGGLLIGLVWELYEFGVWKLSGDEFPANYIGDTQLDLIVDVVGAYVGYRLVRFITNSNRTAEGSEESEE